MAGHAQASSTASRWGDLQIGAGFALGTSNYNKESLRGFTIYSSFDLRRHLGVEFDIHQTAPSYGTQVSERTYELGGRYHLNLKNYHPYGKLMYGRGVFNYPNNIANLAYTCTAWGEGWTTRSDPPSIYGSTMNASAGSDFPSSPCSQTS